MKTLLLVAALIWSVSAGAAVDHGFTNSFAEPNWSPLVGPLNGSAGAAPQFNGVDSATITSPAPLSTPEDGDLSDYVQLTIVVPRTTRVTFSWTYDSADLSGDATYDPFGILTLDGTMFTQLTTDGLAPQQSGQLTLVVDAGDVFGFRISALLGDFGTASVTISEVEFEEVVQAIPEPGALSLLLAAALAAALATHRRSKRLN